MKTNIQKWGNSLGVRIPAQLAQKLHLHSGSVVEILIEDDHIGIYPKKYTLSSMLSKITDDNRPNIEWIEEPSKGNEAW
ncbi:MAG: AbrB/MazE/SpoVT family DNA-binding domain-containing protein [Alphaproteobacteria bacterium]|nr:AbrB/MazE/SpoVT family DNA-binding domain-containing protein [Alphaproteobacteria bacterium]